MGVDLRECDARSFSFLLLLALLRFQELLDDNMEGEGLRPD